MKRRALDNYTQLAFHQRYQVLNPRNLSFRDASLEQEYQADFAATIARQLRLALALAFVLYVNFAFLDYLLVPEKMWTLWSIRAVTCSLLAGLFALTFLAVFQRVHQQVVFASSLVAAAGIFAMLMITHNQYNHYYYAGINLCITWTLFIVGLRFINALQTVLFIVLLYNCIALFKGLPWVDIIPNNFFLVSNAVIGVFAGYTIEQHSRWQFYQALIIKSNSSQLHRAMLAASLDAVISVDEQGRVIEFNETAEQMFGYSRNEALGQNIGDLIVPEALRAQHQAGFDRYRKTSTLELPGQRLELTAKRRDDSEFPVEMTLRQVNLIGRQWLTAYIRDQTQARAAAQEIAHQREVLQRNEKLASMGTLLAGVAHELNNPLAVVLGQAQLLQETEQEPRVLKRADKIAQAAERCAKIVTTFLNMAREQPPQSRQADLNQLLHQALDLLEGGLRAEQIQVDMHLAETLPQVAVDADQLHQVISNLLINALQAMQASPQKHLRISSGFDAPLAQVWLAIADTGPGVNTELRQRIFEPFFTTKAPGKGTGLGLSVCTGIVQAHGGQLELDATYSAGARFYLRLPVHTSAVAALGTLEKNT